MPVVVVNPRQRRSEAEQAALTALEGLIKWWKPGRKERFRDGQA